MNCFAPAAHPMDERQFLLVRLFLLDRWLNRFDVTLTNETGAPILPLREPATVIEMPA